MTFMEQNAKWIMNEQMKPEVTPAGPTAILHQDKIRTVRRFIETCDNYIPTPLTELSSLAREWKLGQILVKDESKRFGLNAFKVTGGIYAIASEICQRTGMNVETVTFEKLKSKEIKDQLGDLVFVTATDGNHGKGVAWAARELGQKSVIFMPKGSSEFRLKSIQKEGAEASITDLNYDDAVRHAKAYADAHNGIVIQDTAWKGYETVPVWIMQGYAVIADEINTELNARNQLPPTHLFLQAGVGSFASAILGYMVETWKTERPATIILEPDQADCYYQTALINDGKPHAVTGDMNTIMAGLACGEPNPISWEIIRKYAHGFVSCPDYLAARGMRILAAPLPGDIPIVSGESGAIGIGFLSELMTNPEFVPLRSKLGINETSRILVISTEGNTDPEAYRNIVWEGSYASI